MRSVSNDLTQHPDLPPGFDSPHHADVGISEVLPEMPSLVLPVQPHECPKGEQLPESTDRVIGTGHPVQRAGHQENAQPTVVPTSFAGQLAPPGARSADSSPVYIIVLKILDEGYNYIRGWLMII